MEIESGIARKWHKEQFSIEKTITKECKNMSKLTVESIINIYGGGVKEIKAYNEAKRTKVEDFLQIEPAAFSLSDEPDVLKIYIDKESAAASTDGELKENEAEVAEEEKRTKEYQINAKERKKRQ